MPIYEYQCKQCDTIFEEWCRRIDDHDAPPCPECNGAAKRLISHTSFALKGEGWYVTEYGSHKNAPKEGTAESNPSSDSPAGAAATPTEAKAPAVTTAPSPAKAAPSPAP